jgi:hypothetical protein
VKKLTLSADERVIDAAKRYAKQHGTSVSALFSRFVLSVTAEEPQEQHKLPTKSLTRKATGLVSLPEGISTDSLLEDALLGKYEIGR